MNKYPKLEMRELSTLKAHPDGVRTAEAEDEYRLGKSLAHFGLLRPPFVLNARTGALLDGDRMLRPCREAGLAHVPVWVVDLPEEDEDAAHLALQNHVGEWQWQPVSELLKALVARKLDVGLTGFHSSDTGPLLAAEWKPAQVGPLDGSDPRQGGLL
jgi:ParB-like chromosome segregation protein Spo0J